MRCERNRTWSHKSRPNDDQVTQLIEQHRKYVVGLAKKIARQLRVGVDFADLIASGNVGLIEVTIRELRRYLEVARTESAAVGVTLRGGQE